MSAQAVLAAPWSKVDGKTIGQWSQGWLRWVTNANSTTPVGTPFGAYPSSDGTTYQASPANADVGQSGPIFFLYGGDWGTAPTASAGNLSQDPTINVPLGKDILLPLINATDLETGNAGDSTIPNWPKTHLPYSVEAKLVTALANFSIDEAHLTVATTADPTHPFLTLNWPKSDAYIADSGVFSLGKVPPGSYLASVPLTTNDVPYADVAGRWAMLTGLGRGDYVVNFGGSGRAVYDPLDSSRIIFGGPGGTDWRANTTDILHVA
jgi:hypothetical protein